MLAIKALLTCTVAITLASCGDSETAQSGQPAATPQTTAQAQAFEGSQNGSLLTLTGRVVASEPGWFRLNIGSEIITVEMDDWDWYKEGRALAAGDQVSVTGRVDKDLYEQKKLEASSVYVPRLGLNLYASGADEEELAPVSIQGDPGVTARGYVTAIEGTEFTIGSITGPVRVETSKLANRPPIKVGDRVYAWGDLDLDLREKAELMARGVVIVAVDITKKDVS